MDPGFEEWFQALCDKPDDVKYKLLRAVYDHNPELDPEKDGIDFSIYNGIVPKLQVKNIIGDELSTYMALVRNIVKSCDSITFNIDAVNVMIGENNTIIENG